MTSSSSSSAHPLHQEAPRLVDDGADGGRFVEGGDDEADRLAAAVLELDEAVQVGELDVPEVGLGEPAVDAHGDGARGGRRALGGLQRLRLTGARLERGRAQRLPRLDHDDRRPGLLGDRLGQGAEEAARRRAAGLHALCRPGRAHDQDLGRLGLAEDGLGDAAAVDQARAWRRGRDGARRPPARAPCARGRRRPGRAARRGAPPPRPRRSGPGHRRSAWPARRGGRRGQARGRASRRRCRAA